MNESSIRDIFLSMQFPPVDEIVATSKTDFRTIRKSRRSCFRTYPLAKGNQKIDDSNELIDQLIDDVQKQNQQIKKHLDEEKKAIDDLLSKKRKIDLWRQLTSLVLLPSNRKKSFDDQLIVYDLTEKKTVEFNKDENQSAPSKVWNYLSRHIPSDMIDNILQESTNSNSYGQSSTGQNAVKKARRTNDATQKIRPSCAKTLTKNKRATRRSRM